MEVFKPELVNQIKGNIDVLRFILRSYKAWYSENHKGKPMVTETYIVQYINQFLTEFDDLQEDRLETMLKGLSVWNNLISKAAEE